MLIFVVRKDGSEAAIAPKSPIADRLFNYATPKIGNVAGIPLGHLSDTRSPNERAPSFRS
jgi:hypothetical protein